MNDSIFSIDIRIYYEDTDAGGVVYYSNYLKFLERCRTEWLRASGYEQADLLRGSNIAFVVRSASLDYLKPARLDDLIHVGLAIEKITRSQLFFKQSVWRKSAEEGGGVSTLVDAKIQIVCVNVSPMKIVSIPPFLRAALDKKP